MGGAKKTREFGAGSSVIGRMVKYFLKACAFGGFVAGSMGVLLVMVGALVNPDGFRLGARNETGPEFLMQIIEWASMFFVFWGLGGLIVGAIVGLLGCVLIVLRR
jgi:hypothetical protein